MVTYRGYNETEVSDNSNISALTRYGGTVLCRTSNNTNVPMLRIEYVVSVSLFFFFISLNITKYFTHTHRYRAYLVRGEMKFNPIHILIARNIETQEFPDEVRGETYLHNGFPDPVQVRDILNTHRSYMNVMVW